MYRILIVSEDFVLRKAVAFSLNDLDACVECADTVGAMLVLHRESPFDLVIVMGTAAEMCRQDSVLLYSNADCAYLNSSIYGQTHNESDQQNYHQGSFWNHI